MSPLLTGDDRLLLKCQVGNDEFPYVAFRLICHVGDPLAVGGEGDFRYPCQAVEGLYWGQIMRPHANGLVSAARGEVLSVGRPGDAGDAGRMPRRGFLD